MYLVHLYTELEVNTELGYRIFVKCILNFKNNRTELKSNYAEPKSRGKAERRDQREDLIK